MLQKITFLILFLTNQNSKKMAMPKIEVVKEVPQCTLGEAPHWCPEEQVLYFVMKYDIVFAFFQIAIEYKMRNNYLLYQR